MRIQFDPVKSNPSHSLSKRTVRLILAVLPSDWIAEIDLVRIGNQLPSKSCFERPVIFSSVCRRLTILDRGLTAEKVAEEVYTEMVQRKGTGEPYNKNILKAHIGNGLDSRQKSAIKPIVESLLRLYRENI